MKKIERLKFIESEFGKEFVLPYKVCHDEKDITKAVREFELKKATWGMRTDLASGNNQGYLLPFILKGSLDKALNVFRERGRELVYIISHNILNYACNGVAIPFDEEHVFFEINPKDNVSQRNMYDNPSNLRQLFIGPSRKIFYENMFFNGFKPEDDYVYDLRLSEIYNLVVGRGDVNEVTFSVRKPDKKVVIW